MSDSTPDRRAFLAACVAGPLGLLCPRSSDPPAMQAEDVSVILPPPFPIIPPNPPQRVHFLYCTAAGEMRRAAVAPDVDLHGLEIWRSGLRLWHWTPTTRPIRISKMGLPGPGPTAIYFRYREADGQVGERGFADLVAVEVRRGTDIESSWMDLAGAGLTPLERCRSMTCAIDDLPMLQRA